MNNGPGPLGAPDPWGLYIMRPITFDVRLDFRNSKSRDRSRRSLLWMLESLVSINRLWLQNNPGTPLLYKSDVIYKRELPGMEVWKDIPTILEDGYGDCEDLACWRVAEYHMKGIKARPYITWKRNSTGGWLYHALVWLPGEKIEDPSLSLGMRGFIKRQPIIRDIPK